MAWYFLGWFSRISDGHPYPFYPEVPPPPVHRNDPYYANSNTDRILIFERTAAQVAQKENKNIPSFQSRFAT